MSIFYLTVCKRFNQEVDNYLANHPVIFDADCFDETFWDNTPAITIPLEKLLSKCPKLTKLCTCIFDSELSDEIYNIPEMTYLTELTIDIVQIKANHAQLETLFKKCPNVIKLYLKQFEEFESSTFDFNCLGDKVTELHFSGVTPQTFKDLMNTKTFNLDLLSLRSHQVYRQNDLKDMLLKVNEKYPELKNFELIIWELWGPVNVLPKMPSLENLVLFFDEGDISYDSVKDMLQSMPKLQSLDFTAFDCPKIDQLIELCVQYCPKIERLLNRNIGSPNYVTERGLEFWKKLPHLKTVNEKTVEEWQTYEPEKDEIESLSDN